MSTTGCIGCIPEIIHKVLCYVDVYTLCRASLVSTMWRAQASRDEIWMHLYHTDLNFTNNLCKRWFRSLTQDNAVLKLEQEASNNTQRLGWRLLYKKVMADRRRRVYLALQKEKRNTALLQIDLKSERFQRGMMLFMQPGYEIRPPPLLPKIKVALVGQSGVGKTSLLRCILGGKFNPYQPSTVAGAEYLTRTFKHKRSGHSFEIQFCDTSGQSRFHSLMPMYYRDAHTVIIMFSVDDSQSFQHALQVGSAVQGQLPWVHIMLIGNKCDKKQIEVAYEDADKFADEYNAVYLETSARVPATVKQVLTCIVDGFHYLDKYALCEKQL